MEKIIITGASGLIGSRVIELLDKSYCFFPAGFEQGVDITDYNLLENFFQKNPGASSVIHLAAFTDTNAAHNQTEDKNGLCYKINVIGTSNITKLCKKFNKYLIYISTDYVFDGTKKDAYKEEDTPNPLEWYEKTKYWAEQIIEKTVEKYVILRTAYPFRGSYKEKLDIVRKIIKGLKDKNLPPMFSDTIITPTFIDDFCAGLETVIKNRPNGIFHLVGSTSLSPYALAIKVAKTFAFDQKLVTKGSLSQFLENSTRAYPRYLNISNQKIQKTLGVKMHDIDSALLLLKQQIEG